MMHKVEGSMSLLNCCIMRLYPLSFCVFSTYLGSECAASGWADFVTSHDGTPTISHPPMFLILTGMVTVHCTLY